MIRTLAPALVLALAAAPASAQSFFDGLGKRAVEQAKAAAAARLEDAARKALSTAMQPANAASAPTVEEDGPVAAPAHAPAEPRVAAQGGPIPNTRSTGPAPWPVNAGSPDVTRPGHLEFSPELKAQAKAFEEFSRVECSSCEGGRLYDAWAQQHFKLRGYGAWEAKVGALRLGETLAWTGAESKGLITIVGETPVSGFACKQLKWELTKRVDRIERPGLFCFGKSGPFAGSDSWVEVF